MVADYFSLKAKWNIKPEGIIHVGAHHGEELNTYFSDADVKNIVFFEASPSTFNVLKRNIDSMQKPAHIVSVDAYPYGLGSEEKEVDFFVASNGQSSSVLKPKLHINKYPSITFNSVEKVQIKTLDSFSLEGFKFLSMDVQGYELEVLKGAENTLKNINWVYTEVNSALLYENCVLIEDLDKHLANRGFKREDTVWASDDTNWGDALYVRV
jgi:FkbM family methyltransferase